MAHQPRDDGGSWSCGMGASTWVPCAKHVHGRLFRILMSGREENEKKCGKIGKKLGCLWQIHNTKMHEKMFLERNPNSNVCVGKYFVKGTE